MLCGAAGNCIIGWGFSVESTLFLYVMWFIINKKILIISTLDVKLCGAQKDHPWSVNPLWKYFGQIISVVNVMPNWHTMSCCSRPLLLICVSYHRLVKTSHLGQVYFGITVTYSSVQSVALPAKFLFQCAVELMSWGKLRVTLQWQ